VAPIETLLEGIIDYAGLFPPAGLPMETAVANYASYRQSADRAALAAFVLPVARLGEFFEATDHDGEPWPLSLLWTRGAKEDGSATASMIDRDTRVKVQSIEARADQLADLSELGALSRGLPLFVEFSWHDDPNPWIAAIKAQGLCAKIRTGGVEASSIPPVNAVGRFLRACVDVGVAFKATAGLHHPVRAQHALTYETGAARAVMHGFLNVFLAAFFYSENALDEAGLVALLDERDPSSFRLTGESVVWREFSASVSALAVFRRTMARSFGSCSFTEPLEDLRHLEIR
jgi:hypothetical protein